MDRDLKELLQKWELSDPAPQLDERVMAMFLRRSRLGMFRWKGSVRLPLPVCVPLLLLQLVSAGAILHYRFFAVVPSAPVLSMPERVVKVPVVKEKLVTRVVYLPARAVGDPVRRTAHPPAYAEGDRQVMDLTGFQPVPELHIYVTRGNPQ